MQNELCQFHYATPATSSIMIEGGGTIYVCKVCRDRILGPKRYICKYCGVLMKSDKNLEGDHEYTCPRREQWGLKK